MDDTRVLILEDIMHLTKTLDDGILGQEEQDVARSIRKLATRALAEENDDPSQRIDSYIVTSLREIQRLSKVLNEMLRGRDGYETSRNIRKLAYKALAEADMDDVD